MQGDLVSIEIRLPSGDKSLEEGLFALLSAVGRRDGGTMTFPPPEGEYLPRVSLAFRDVEKPIAHFATTADSIELVLAGAAGSPLADAPQYSAISIDELRDRLQGHGISGLDHLGIDLPWFDGEHPHIRDLRERIKDSCAYYRFPTGEWWDFVLPATRHELTGTGDIDLGVVRRPKFELVTIATTATPIVQIDVMAALSFGEIAALFPEGIADPTLENVWVYVQNNCDIDLCLVIGAEHRGDWSSHFAGHRVG